MNTEDTIAAICTGIGGAISIIRVSGPEALEIADKIWQGQQKPARELARTMLLGQTVTAKNQPGDPALCVYFPNPGSYTGDDVIEIHCHGGLLTSRRTLEAAVNAGARLAEPGEFTYRAFINGKMDLTQAEAVADLISAHSDMALHLAERQIAGKLAERIHEIRDELIIILAECESRLDFVEEDLDWTAGDKFCATLTGLNKKVIKLLQSKTEGAILRNGIRVVIGGKPNAGKSSLLNLLLGFDRAIVTQLPGTTRDTIEETANIRNIPVKLIDTAGIREVDDLIEGIGIERSLESLKQAQVILWLMDASADDPEAEFKTMKEHTAHADNVIPIWNKTDEQKVKLLPHSDVPTGFISIRDEAGIEEFLDIFEKAVWQFPHTEEPEIAVSSRHALLLEEASKSLPNAAAQIQHEDWELAAIHLKEAVANLGLIIGEEVDPDILDTIFGKFCIGK